MKLNCDMGESFGRWNMGMDQDIMPYVDMANIACGFHASDPFTMAKTVLLAKQHGVVVGAHPGYPDLLGFGRREMLYSSDEITNMVLYQVGALQAICHANQKQVEYVKPHGALYNAMMQDDTIMDAILMAMSSLEKPIPLMVLANHRVDQIRSHAERYSVPLLFESFGDRAYNDAGNLVPRTDENAFLTAESELEQRVSDLVVGRRVTTVTGNTIPIEADTICVHGDSQQALALVKKIRGLIDSL